MRDEFKFRFDGEEEVCENDLVGLGSNCDSQVFESFNSFNVRPVGELKW